MVYPVKKCHRCGARNLDGALYCRKCGAYLGELNDDVVLTPLEDYNYTNKKRKNKKSEVPAILVAIFFTSSVWSLLIISVFMTMAMSAKDVSSQLSYLICNLFMTISLIINILATYFSLAKRGFTFLMFASIINIISIFNFLFGIIALIVLLIKRKEWESK